MEIELKCVVCKKKFIGLKNKKYCSIECKNQKRRERRHIKNYDYKKNRKKANRKYYLKTKYKLTKKYEEEKIKKREDKKIKDKIWKINNKEKNAEYRRRTRGKIRGWFDEYKKTLKCEYCGYNRCYEALDFHHKDLKEKEFNIGHSFFKKGKEKILEEIKKCIVLCSNCHRELHFKEKQKTILKKREDYLKIINQPKKIYYAVVEKELEKEWFKKLNEKAKYNLNRFGGNQYIRIDSEITEKIDIKKELSSKIKIGEKTICRILQIYKRGTEEQKERARTGKDSIYKVYKELEPIRYCKNKRE